MNLHICHNYMERIYMDLSSFFPEEFVIKEVNVVLDNVTIEIISIKNSCKCPICNTDSSRIYSHYNRFLFNLSIR